MQDEFFEVRDEFFAPGEEITPALLRSKEELWSAGYELQGTEDHTLTSIWIMKEDTLS